MYYIFKNCTEATSKTSDGLEQYDCLKCYEDNKLLFNPETGIHYCQYEHKANICMVKYCKTCKNGNNYFCSECLSSNYEVNSITGSCVEKSEVVPAITWKDIYRLEMNSNKEINGQIIHGPSLRLRGISTSEINTRHAFLIYLTFKIKTGRNLEEEDEKKIPAICEALNNVGKNEDLNMIDYECIGNTTGNEDLTNYKLDDIDEGSNDELLKKSNLKELAQEKKTDTGEIELETETEFKLDDLIKVSIFSMDEISQQIATNYTFDFKIDGEINKAISPFTIPVELELNEVDKKADCNFVVEENQKASLSCTLNIEQYKEQKSFTFKAAEIRTDGNEIYLSKIDEVLLVNKVQDVNEEKKEENQEGKQEGKQNKEDGKEEKQEIKQENQEKEEEKNQNNFGFIIKVLLAQLYFYQALLYL